MELQLREAEQRKKLADNVSWHSHMQKWALCVFQPAGHYQIRKPPFNVLLQGGWLHRLVGQCPIVLLTAL